LLILLTVGLISIIVTNIKSQRMLAYIYNNNSSVAYVSFVNKMYAYPAHRK